jgi:hypothetical protein
LSWFWGSRGGLPSPRQNFARIESVEDPPEPFVALRNLKRVRQAQGYAFTKMVNNFRW